MLILFKPIDLKTSSDFCNKHSKHSGLFIFTPLTTEAESGFFMLAYQFRFGILQKEKKN